MTTSVWEKPHGGRVDAAGASAPDAWIEKGANLAAALGLALIENGWRVLFTRKTDLAYATKDQAETSTPTGDAPPWTRQGPRTTADPRTIKASS